MWNKQAAEITVNEVQSPVCCWCCRCSQTGDTRGQHGSENPRQGVSQTQPGKGDSDFYSFSGDLEWLGVPSVRAGSRGPQVWLLLPPHRGALGPGQRPVLGSRFARCRSWEGRADLGVLKNSVSPARLKRGGFICLVWITRENWFCIDFWALWLTDDFLPSVVPSGSLQMLWAHLRGFLYLPVCSCTGLRQAGGQKEVPFVIESPWQYRISLTRASSGAQWPPGKVVLREYVIQFMPSS